MDDVDVPVVAGVGHVAAAFAVVSIVAAVACVAVALMFVVGCL